MSADVHPSNNHGHSAAAWTGVIICLLGSCIIAYGIGFDATNVAYVGGVVFILGGIIGFIMSKAAKGKAPKGRH